MSSTPKAVGDERKHKSCIGCNWGRDLIRVVGAMGCKVGSYIQRLGDEMSAQSKAMYWQARCRELEAMAKKMDSTLITIALNSCCKTCREAGLLARQTLAECDAMKGGK